MEDRKFKGIQIKSEKNILYFPDEHQYCNKNTQHCIVFLKKGQKPGFSLGLSLNGTAAHTCLAEEQVSYFKKCPNGSKAEA